MVRKFQHGKRLLSLAVEEEEFAGNGSVGLDRKVYAARYDCGAEETEESRPHLKSGDRVKRF